MSLDTNSSNREDLNTIKSEGQPDRDLFIRRVAALAFAVGISVLIFLNRDAIESLGLYGYPGVFVISALGNATLVLPAPSFLIVFALAGALNPVWLGLSAGCGAAIGEMTGYLAGFSGRGIIEDKPLFQRLTVLMRTWGAWLIFVLAFIPNPLFDIGGVLAGVLRIRWWKFLLAAAAGKSLRFILIAYFGEFFIALFNF